MGLINRALVSIDEEAFTFYEADGSAGGACAEYTGPCTCSTFNVQL